MKSGSWRAAALSGGIVTGNWILASLLGIAISKYIDIVFDQMTR
jgi:hypothetical protein